MSHLKFWLWLSGLTLAMVVFGTGGALAEKTGDLKLTIATIVGMAATVWLTQLFYQRCTED